MTEHTSPTGGPAGGSTDASADAPSGSTMTEPPVSPYDSASPAWTPPYPGYPAPAAAKPTFRERGIKLWHAIAVGAACLVLGLGFGALIGHQTAGSGSDGFRPPALGNGQGPNGQGDGQGSGRDFGGPGLGQAPGSQSDGQSNGQSSGQSGTSS